MDAEKGSQHGAIRQNAEHMRLEWFALRPEPVKHGIENLVILVIGIRIN
jgi:hypothetical protein